MSTPPVLAPATFALCAALTATSTALAVEPQADTGRLWLTSGFLSKHHTDHMAPRRGWNESNGGIGVEVALNPRWRLMAGVYDNSVYATSRYVHATWSPDLLQHRIGPVALRVGAAVGTVDGYPGMRGGGFFPTLLPVASLEWKRIGLNFTYIPSIPGNVAGAFALQAKLRLF